MSFVRPGRGLGRPETSEKKETPSTTGLRSGQMVVTCVSQRDASVGQTGTGAISRVDTAVHRRSTAVHVSDGRVDPPEAGRTLDDMFG